MKRTNPNILDNFLQTQIDMKNHYTKSNLLIIALATMSILLTLGYSKNAFAEGNGGTGGGMGILTSTGEVKLLDLTSSQERKLARPATELESMIPQIQQKLGQKAQNFFDCSSAVFADFETQYPVLKELSNIEKEIQPIMVNFPLIQFPAKTESKVTIPFPAVASASSSAELVKQLPIGSYVKGRLWIVGPIYSKMKDDNQCGLQIHESLRHLNYKLKLVEELMTQEIENLTQYFMGYKKAEEVSRELARLSNMKPEPSLIKVRYNKMVSDFNKTIHDKSVPLVIRKKVEVKLNTIMQKSNTFDSLELIANQYSEMGNEIMEMIRNKEVSHVYEVTYRAYQESQGYWINSSSVLADGVSAIVKSLRPALDKLNVPASLIEIVLTEENGPWDIRTFEKVQYPDF